MKKAEPLFFEETEWHYVATMELPGANIENIDIIAEGGSLLILAPLTFGRFERAMPLPEGVNTKLIEAVYRNNLLSIAIPKIEAVEPLRLRTARAQPAKAA